MSEEKDEATNYTRWSNEQQRGNSSKGRQKSFADEVCEELGLTLTDTIIDDGISARYGDNLKANFATLLTRNHPPKYLIIEEWSRLSRAGFWTTAQEAILPLVNRGIKVVVGRDDDGQLVIITDKNIHSKRIITYMLDGSTFAQKDNESRINKFVEAWVEKRKKIQSGGYAPLNFPPCWLKCPRDEKGKCIKDADFIQDDVIVKRIQQVFRLFVENDWSVYHTLHVLNNPTTGISPVVKAGKSFGKKWTIAALQRLLRNKAVIGYYQRRQFRDKNYNKPTGVIEWESKIYKPIVDKDTYWKAQEKLDRMYRGRRQAYSQRSTNLLYRVLQCKCGGYMNIHHNTHKGKLTISYICGNAIGGICPSKYNTMRQDQVEFALKTILSKSSVLYDILNQEQPIAPSLAPVYQIELDQLRKERGNLYSLLKKLDTQPSDLVASIQQSLDKEKRLQRQIEEENIRMAGTKPLKQELLSHKEILSKWDDEPSRIKIRQLCRDLITKTETDTKDKTMKIWIRNVSEPIDVKLNEDACEINGMKYPYDPHK